MGCGASIPKAGPCAPVHIPCSGETSSRLNSTSKNKKTTTSSPKTNKAAELRRKAIEDKLKKTDKSSSSVSLKHSASKCAKSKVTPCQRTSSATSTRTKDNRPNTGTKAKPKNCHSANLPLSPHKTAKNATEARSASYQSVKSIKSTSKPAKDGPLNTINDAKKRSCQPSKRPQASPTLKKSSSDTTAEAKQLGSQSSQRPTSSPTKRHKQPQTAIDAKLPSCQPKASPTSKDKPVKSACEEKRLCSKPERPSSSPKESLSIIKTKAEANQKCSGQKVRPRSTPLTKTTVERNHTSPQPTKRPQSGSPSKGHPIEAINKTKQVSCPQSINRPTASHLPKENLPQKTTAVKRKDCQSPKSPELRPASKDNPLKTVEACETGQHAAREGEILTDTTDKPSLVDQSTEKDALKEGAITREGVVVDNIQESSASEAELDYFISEILQSQMSLVQNVPCPDKIPKPLNTRSPTLSSPPPGAGPEQGEPFMATTTEATVENNSDCPESSNTSSEGSKEMEMKNGVSKVTPSPSPPTGRKENKNSEENSTSPTPSYLTVFPKENADIDSTEVREESQSGVDVRKGSGNLRSSPSAIRSQEKVSVEAKGKRSKASIDKRKSPRNSTSDSNAKVSKSVSKLRAGDSAKDSSHSHTATPSTSRPSSSRSNADSSVGLNRRKSSQRPSSSVKTPPEKSNAGANAENKGPLKPKDTRSEFKGSKISGSQGLRSSSSTTLSKRSVSRNSSKSGIISPTSSVVDKDLKKSGSNDKANQLPGEQKNVVKKQSSSNEQVEDAKLKAKGRIDASHSHNRLSTCSLPKADLEQRPKSGRSVTMGSTSSIVRSEERLSDARSSSPKQPEIRNSPSKSSLKRRIPSPSENKNERSGSARSSRHSPRQFEILNSSKTLHFSTPTYPEVRSRNSRSKTSLNKMEILNSEYEQKQVISPHEKRSE